jgi:hypothetical protein
MKGVGVFSLEKFRMGRVFVEWECLGDWLIFCVMDVGVGSGCFILGGCGVVGRMSSLNT